MDFHEISGCYGDVIGSTNARLCGHKASALYDEPFRHTSNSAYSSSSGNEKKAVTY